MLPWPTSPVTLTTFLAIVFFIFIIYFHPSPIHLRNPPISTSLSPSHTMPSVPAPPDAALFAKMRLRPPPTTLVPEAGFDASTVWVPYTAGGDKLDIPRIALLEPQHYEQGVKKYNRKIWDLYPFIAEPTLEGKWEQDKPVLDA